MEIIKFIQGFSNPFLDKFFSIITNLGGQSLGIFLSILFIWCIDKKFGYRFLYGILFSFNLNNIIKGLVNSKRPIGIEGIRSLQVHTATGSSFPSGHSQGNATTITLLLDQFRYRWLFVLGFFMFILIPLSRLYLGVHWPIDVILGSIIGIISAFISNKIFNLSNLYERKILVFSLFFYLILALIVPNDDLYKALGALSAFIIGMLIEEKYINYNPKTSFMKNIIKFLIGMLGALIIYLLFSLLPKSIYVSYIKYFCLCFWAIVLAPLLFIKLNLAKKYV